jgi:hypothetical protein
MPVIIKPSVMPGMIRKGLDVSVAELEKTFPGTSRETLDQTARILKDTIVESLGAVSCSQWGYEVQARYNELVNESLALASVKTVQDGARHNSRLYALLSEVAQAFRDNGPHDFAFWKKQVTPQEKFEDAHDELEQLRGLLGNALPVLRAIQTRLEKLSHESLRLATELDASGIAAHYVADTLGAGDDRSSHLMDQSVSLTKTIAHIREGILLRQESVQEIDALADRIQESVLTTLPAWIEKATLVFHNPSATDTERYTLRQGLEDIVRQLK